MNHEDNTGTLPKDSLLTLTSLVKPLYEAQEGNHSWIHILACLDNITLLEAAATKEELAIPSLFDIARITILLHDLDRLKMEDKIPELAKEIKLTPEILETIQNAIYNHNKPQSRWRNAALELSKIVYNADKMDTIRDRFLKTKNVKGVTVPSTDNDYYGYVLMVRDSVSQGVPYNTLTKQLPPELHVDPSSPSVTSSQMKAYVSKMREIWKEINLPMKRTASKYVLKATSNANYTNEIASNYPVISEDEIYGLTPLRLQWFNYVRGLKMMSEVYLSSVYQLVEIADNPELNTAELISTIKEKLFVYNSFLQAIISYPRDHEEDLLLLMNRTRNPARLHQNYAYAEKKLDDILLALEETEREKRRAFFKSLVEVRLQDLSHYSPIGDVDALHGGRRLMEKLVRNLYNEHNEQSIIELVNKAIETKDSIMARKLVRYFRQDVLRAVDHVNDAMRTDRFVYMLLTGQTIHSPVGKLPHIYRFDAKELTNHGLHYFAPSHPQAFHVMKLLHSFEEMPKIIEDSIDFFVQGMYIPTDFIDVCTDILAALFSVEEMDKETFTFLFEHIIVNEESVVTKNSDGVFVADEWLEMDFASRGNPLWQKAFDSLEKINTFCKKMAIIPPFRPYAVVEADLLTREHLRNE